MYKTLISLALSLTTVTLAHANILGLPLGGWNPPVQAPEIDPATALSAFTLLAGALAIARGRRSKQ